MGVKKFVWMQINLKRLAHFASIVMLRLSPFEFFPCNCHRRRSRETGGILVLSFFNLVNDPNMT
jgi:hypothetical protein